MPGGVTCMFFITDVFSVQNITFLFRKLLVSTSQIEILEILVCLTLNLLTTTIVAPPSNDSKWQMGFNSVFKGLMLTLNVERAIPPDALRRQMPSTVILAYSMDVRSGLI